MTDDNFHQALRVFFFQPLRGWRRWSVYLAAVALFVPAYFHLGEELIRQTNLDIMASDQAASISLAHKSKNDPFPLRSSYIQPLWPWISTFVLQDDVAAYFVRGKMLNLALGCAASVLIFILGAAAIAPVPAYMMGLVAGFGVFLQRAHFFHPEPLLYAFFAGAVAGMLLSLRSNAWWLHAGWGICLGFGYLAKASVGPLLAVYAGATLVLVLARAGALPGRLACAREQNGPAWSLTRHIAGTAGALLLCAAIIAPNAIYKTRTHDDPFFSPAKYWMWCDDWNTEAYPLLHHFWTGKARAEFGRANLPSMANYLRKHGWRRAVSRLTEGVEETAGTFFLPGGRLVPALFVFSQKGNSARGEPDRVWRLVLPARGLYIAALALMVSFLFLERLRRDGPPLYRTPSGIACCTYLSAMLIIFTLAFGWYAVIGRGERFSLMLYVPLLVSLVCAGWLLARSSRGPLPRLVFAGGICVVLIHAIIQVFRLLSLPQFSKNFW